MYPLYIDISTAILIRWRYRYRYCHRTVCETPTEGILMQLAIESEDTHHNDTVELMN